MKKILFSALFLITLYCVAWFYMGFEIKKSINQFYDVDAPQEGYILHGDKPSLSGFPFKPVITYKKGLEINGTNITFDTLKIAALPFPKQTLDLNIDTLAIHPPPKKQLYEINEVKSKIVIPKSFPSKFTKPNLTAWQKEIGKIKVKYLELDKNSMITTAKGHIGLDKNLQPSLDLETKMTDHHKLINFLTVETSELSTIQGAIALGVLNSMAKTDETTNQKTVEFDIKIKDRKLSLGPISSLKIPKIYWPEK